MMCLALPNLLSFICFLFSEELYILIFGFVLFGFWFQRLAWHGMARAGLRGYRFASLFGYLKRSDFVS